MKEARWFPISASVVLFGLYCFFKWVARIPSPSNTCIIVVPTRWRGPTLRLTSPPRRCLISLLSGLELSLFLAIPTWNFEKYCGINIVWECVVKKFVSERSMYRTRLVKRSPTLSLRWPPSTRPRYYIIYYCLCLLLWHKQQQLHNNKLFVFQALEALPPNVRVVGEEFIEHGVRFYYRCFLLLPFFSSLMPLCYRWCPFGSTFPRLRRFIAPRPFYSSFASRVRFHFWMHFMSYDDRILMMFELQAASLSLLSSSLSSHSSFDSFRSDSERERRTSLLLRRYFWRWYSLSQYIFSFQGKKEMEEGDIEEVKRKEVEYLFKVRFYFF